MKIFGMKDTHFWTIVIIFAAVFYLVTSSGTQCPQFSKIRPCFCSETHDSYTIFTCTNIQNSSELAQATQGMKSMIIDRIMFFGSFMNVESQTESQIADNLLSSAAKNVLEPDINAGERLPLHWLSSTRVRELEIQDVQLSNCFLCNDPFEGQDDFLTSLVVIHSTLEGNLCSVCNTKTKSVSTRYLQKLNSLKYLDFSFNSIEVVSGNAFPATLRGLRKINLSNNHILRIHDNAFSNLNQLEELDLSNNKLTTVTRKILRPTDDALLSLDLSWNSIQNIPVDMFVNLRKLKEIKLSHNLLEVLSDSTFLRMAANMQKVDVKGNFLVCNCTSSWIKRTTVTKITGKCIAPKEVEFQDIKSSLSTIQKC